MSDRKALLIGSMPYQDETHAMTHALDVLGDSLFCLPDGEIGEKTDEFPKGKRAAWVMTAINQCIADTDHWEVTRQSTNAEDGFPADYDQTPQLRPKHPPAQMHNYLNFGYHEFFKSSYPIFQQLRRERGLEHIKFQVGIPTGLGVTFSMMPPLTALRYATAFNKRLAWEVNQIAAIAKEDVVFQIEVPGELALAYRLPGFLHGLAVRGIHALVQQIQAGTHFGIHICLGDLNNKALVHAKTLDKMVSFSNKLVAGWSPQHHLDYVHFPLAEAETPPPLDAHFYEPLRHIHLPKGVRFVAGFVHEKLSSEDGQRLRTIIESVRGDAVDIACSCGMGRRSEAIATDLIQKMHALTD